MAPASTTRSLASTLASGSPFHHRYTGIGSVRGGTENELPKSALGIGSPRVASEPGWRVIEQHELRCEGLHEIAPGAAERGQRRRMHEAEPHERFSVADGRGQAAYVRHEDRGLEYPERLIAEQGIDVGELAHGEDRLVPAPTELAAEREQPHQVSVVATELPREKDARHRAMVTHRSDRAFARRYAAARSPVRWLADVDGNLQSP